MAQPNSKQPSRACLGPPLPASPHTPSTCAFPVLAFPFPRGISWICILALEISRSPPGTRMVDQCIFCHVLRQRTGRRRCALLGLCGGARGLHTGRSITLNPRNISVVTIDILGYNGVYLPTLQRTYNKVIIVVG